MVVMVECVVNLKRNNIVCAVITVDRINNPSLHLVEQTVFTVIVFSLEICVLQEVLAYLAVGYCPSGLVAIVFSTQGGI